MVIVFMSRVSCPCVLASDYYFQAMSESITSVCGGCVSSSGYDEVVAATYAGWVVGLTTEPQRKEAGPTTASQEPISDEVQAKIDNLRYYNFYTAVVCVQNIEQPVV